MEETWPRLIEIFYQLPSSLLEWSIAHPLPLALFAGLFIGAFFHRLLKIMFFVALTIYLYTLTPLDCRLGQLTAGEWEICAQKMQQSLSVLLDDEEALPVPTTVAPEKDEEENEAESDNASKRNLRNNIPNYK